MKCELGINMSLDVIGDGITFKSTIQDITHEYIIITYPISNVNGKYYITHRGCIIEFYIKIKDAIYKINAMVLDKKRESYGEVLIISLPQKVENIQRREYFRYRTNRPIKYSVLYNKSSYASTKDVPQKYFLNMKQTTIIDISGGGVKFNSQEKIDVGETLLISIPLSKEILTVLGIVIRVDSLGMGTYAIVVKYENIKEVERDKIIFTINKWIIEDKKNKIDC